MIVDLLVFLIASLSSKSQKEGKKIMMKRVKANDPLAINLVGAYHLLKEEYAAAFKYYTKAELGDADAHFQLATLYRRG